VSPRTAGRKAVYVCPDCGHESPVDGDWLVAEREVAGDHMEVYGCPVCGGHVLSQPRFDDAHGSWLQDLSPVASGPYTVGDSVTAATRSLGDIASALACGRLVR